MIIKTLTLDGIKIKVTKFFLRFLAKKNKVKDIDEFIKEF